jgi:hypothetical protein
MTFSVFCAELSAPVTFDSLGAAINAACKFTKEGAIVYEIKGVGGFAMERSDIEIECLRRNAGTRI